VLIQSTIALINSLMHHVSDTYYDDFTDELEQNEVPRAVIVRHFSLDSGWRSTYLGNEQSMIDGNRGEDVVPLIIQFQSNIISFCHRQQKAPVDPFNAKHRALLDDIVRAADLESEEPYGALGFSSERPELDFDKVGLLGLKTMWRFSKKPEFPKVSRTSSFVVGPTIEKNGPSLFSSKSHDLLTAGIRLRERVTKRPTFSRKLLISTRASLRRLLSSLSCSPSTEYMLWL
jgi:hypothetical protein